MFPIITTLDELIMYTGHIYYPGDWGNSLFYAEMLAAEQEAEITTADETITIINE